jgi:hypothetical protein
MMATTDITISDITNQVEKRFLDFLANFLNFPLFHNTVSFSKDNEEARRRLPGMRRAGIRRIVHTLRTPTTQPTKLAKESEVVSVIT